MKILDRFLAKHKTRIVGLDILRTIAILNVVYGHGAHLIPDKFGAAYDNFNLIRLDGVSIYQQRPAQFLDKEMV
jgi:peptidoglycan/LPS O-acetylase OafA/YrhL